MTPDVCWGNLIAVTVNTAIGNDNCRHKRNTLWEIFSGEAGSTGHVLVKRPTRVLITTPPGLLSMHICGVVLAAEARSTRRQVQHWENWLSVRLESAPQKPGADSQHVAKRLHGTETTQHWTRSHMVWVWVLTLHFTSCRFWQVTYPLWTRLLIFQESLQEFR